MAQKFTATVSVKEKISTNVYFVTFKLQEPASIAFRAGQCMMLMCGPGVNRTMSISSLPSDASQVSMIHDISPMGPGSKWTLGLRVGDPVNFVAPTGVFFFDSESPRKKIFVATGTGIAPFRSMIEEYILKNGTATIAVWWGQRYEEDMYWNDLFDQWFQTYPTFSWHQVLSKPRDNWKGLAGHVTEHVLHAYKDFADNDYYLCGNKLMIEDVRTQLLAKNVPKEQIKTELFY